MSEFGKIGKVPDTYINSSGGDTRVSGKDEAQVEADLVLRPISDLIDQLEKATDVEEKAGLQQEMTERAKRGHDILGQSEA